ncbi:hypothetical protein ACFO5K_03345 [Nocardia halotolerans]|uniref:Uncharacterized protein n=1 Tax=Nocardia halotolerans TaxID=1755878 RepID=A0ABV8VBS2_9NOCA
MPNKKSIVGMLGAITLFFGMIFAATATSDSNDWPPADSAKNNPHAPPAPIETIGPFAGTPKDKIPGRPDGRPSNLGPDAQNQGPVGDRPTGVELEKRQRAVAGQNDQWICYSNSGEYVTDIIVTLADPKMQLSKEQRDAICVTNGAVRSSQR